MPASGFVGIDPSSTSTGLAVVGPRGGIKYTSSWVRPKKGDIFDWMVEYYGWITRELRSISVTAGHAAVEQLSVSQNMDTVRKIAYFEALALLACIQNNISVNQVKATSVRKVVYGAGNLSKKQVYEKNAERYGKKLFKSHGKAALDVSDALGLAEYARLSTSE